MGNEASTNNNNKSNNNFSRMGSREASSGSMMVGRLSTHSFSHGDDDDDTNRNNTTPIHRGGVAGFRDRLLRRTLLRNGDNNMNGGPSRQDLFATPRTVFLEFSHSASDSPTAPRDVLGRVEIELFNELPVISEQFFMMCTGEKKTNQHPEYHYKNTKAHRIIPGFLVCQAGDVTKQNGTGSVNIYNDDPSIKVENEYPGRSGEHFPYCLSVAHGGVGSKLGSQFFILSGKTKGEWLNKKHQVFGKVVEGELVCDVVESYGTTSGKTQGSVWISDCGETEESKKRHEDAQRPKVSAALRSAQAAVSRETTGTTSTTAVQGLIEYSSDLPPATHMPPSPSLSNKNTFVFLEFSVASPTARKVGRITIELFSCALPRTSRNFQLLCEGNARYGNRTLHYKGLPIHRVIKDFCLQSGDVEKFDGTAGRCAIGATEHQRYFNDEGHLPHFTGCIATAVSGPNKNNSQFYILTAETRNVSHLDGRDVVFGRVVDGWGFVKEIEQNGTDSVGHSKSNYVISDCGVYNHDDVENEIPRSSIADYDSSRIAEAAKKPPKEAYAHFANHPISLKNNNNTSSSPAKRHHHGRTSSYAEYVGIPLTEAERKKKESAAAASSNSNSDGIIHPPFVRAFENNVLPPEMTKFSEEFLRIIECSVCLNTFDSYSRVPCSLACGHSICFSHLPLIEHCPLCRQEITGKSKIQPNIVLRELCAKFAPTDKESIDISQKPTPRASTPKNKKSGTLFRNTESHRIDFSAPSQPQETSATTDRVQTTTATSRPGSRVLVLDRTTTSTSVRPTSTTTATAAPAASSSTSNNNNNINRRPTGGQHHNCPYDCDILRSQRRCCACMDKRPRRTEFTYEVYIDGQGHVNNAPRWRYYCEKCRMACEREYWHGQ